MSVLSTYKDTIAWAILLAGVVAGLVFGLGWLFAPGGGKGKRPRVEQTQVEGTKGESE